MPLLRISFVDDTCGHSTNHEAAGSCARFIIPMDVPWSFAHHCPIISHRSLVQDIRIGLVWVILHLRPLMPSSAVKMLLGRSVSVYPAWWHRSSLPCHCQALRCEEKVKQIQLLLGDGNVNSCQNFCKDVESGGFLSLQSDECQLAFFSHLRTSHV